MTTPDTSTPKSPLTLSCHCGGITLTVPHAPSVLNECHCTICFAYGALWGYYHPARGEAVTISESDGCNLQSYYRTDGDMTGALAFQRCSRCGCVVAWQRKDPTQGSGKMGVNFRIMGEKVEAVNKVVTHK